MKILVTGGAGFIGSHVVNAYIDAGHQVIVVDNLATGKMENIDRRAVFNQMDFCSPEFRELVLRERPQIINHHAGQTLIHVSTRDPLFDAEVNVKGMIRLLQTCVEAGVGKVIFASSAGVYGQALRMPITENTPFQPENPYAITKSACEYYLRYFSSETGLRYSILRYGNVFGPRDGVASDHVITIFASVLLADRQATIHWDGEQKKDYVYVKDVAHANLLALSRGDNQVFNVAAGIPRTVNQIYASIAKFLAIKKEPVYGPKRRGDVHEAYFDISYARKELGWQPGTSFDEALGVTIEWFKQRN